MWLIFKAGAEKLLWLWAVLSWLGLPLVDLLDLWTLNFFYLRYLWGKVGSASLLEILPSILLESWVIGKTNFGEGSVMDDLSLLGSPHHPSNSVLWGALPSVCHLNRWAPYSLEWKQQKLRDFAPFGLRELQTLSLAISLYLCPPQHFLSIACCHSRSEEIAMRSGNKKILPLEIRQIQKEAGLCWLVTCRIFLWSFGHFTDWREEPGWSFEVLTVPVPEITIISPNTENTFLLILKYVFCLFFPQSLLSLLRNAVEVPVLVLLLS